MSVNNLLKAKQYFSLVNFRIKMMILKLTGEVRAGSAETVVKPQCDIKDLCSSLELAGGSVEEKDQF